MQYLRQGTKVRTKEEIRLGRIFIPEGSVGRVDRMLEGGLATRVIFDEFGGFDCWTNELEVVLFDEEKKPALGKEWSPWQVGNWYQVRTGEVLWYDRDQYHGRIPVEIMDRRTGFTRSRVGEVKVIGNFSPIWVSILGIKFTLDEILRLDHAIADDWIKEEKRRRKLKERGIDRPGPKDWMP